MVKNIVFHPYSHLIHTRTHIHTQSFSIMHVYVHTHTNTHTDSHSHIQVSFFADVELERSKLNPLTMLPVSHSLT